MAACMRNVTLLSRSFGKSCKKHGNYRHMPGFSRYLHSCHLRTGLSYRQRTFFLRHDQMCLQLLTARCASTETPNLPFGYIPDVPIAPLTDVKSMLPELNAIGEPTLESMGLGAFTPPGLVQQCIEIMHVSADVPWFGAIALTALTVRVLVFPMMIYGRKAGVHVRNHMPTINRLQQKINDAKQVDDNLEWHKRTKEFQDYMKRNDIKFRRVIMMPLIQMPILLSVYQAIRGMSLLPVESMKTGGTFWFTDLTLADPYFILPAITSLSILAMIEFGAESQKASDLTHGMKWMMRSMPVLAFVFTCKFASGIALYWTVNNVISLLTMQCLKLPAAKKLFGIPNEVVHKKEVREKKGFLEGFKEMWESNKLQAERDKRRDVDEKTFKKAGVGPVPRTFKHNPVKQKEKRKMSASS